MGTVGAVGGGIMASGGILACPVSQGAGCGVAVLGVGVAGLSAKQAYDGNAALFGPYVSTEGARVLASFGTSTYPGEASPIKEALTETAKFGVIAVAGKLVPKALSAIEGEAVTIKQSSTAVPAGSTRTQVDGANTSEALSSGRTSIADAIKFRQRTLELGYDAARDQLLVREGIGAARFENATGRTVTRTVDGAVDFHDSVLGNFDLKGPILKNDGSAVAITPERLQGLAKSTIKEANFSTASKAVVVDSMGMTSEKIASLKAAVANGVRSTKPIIYIH